MELCAALVIAVVAVSSLCHGAVEPRVRERSTPLRMAAAHQLGRCPVCGRKTDELISCVYEARIFCFCSPECASRFEENPLKHLAKMRDAL